MKAEHIFSVLIIFLLFTGFSSQELQQNSKGYLLMDAETGEVFEEYNADTPLAIASTTKLMSYILFKDALDDGKWRKDTVITCTPGDLRTGSKYGIKPGQCYTVDELMKASLVISGNDATALLAGYLCGTEAEFAKRMNVKAKEIGLQTAVFYNSTGLPMYPKDTQNTMSVRDLAKLSRYILNNYPEILDITCIDKIKNLNEGENQEEFLINTNPLLGTIKGVDGLKTGNTNKAGSCLVWTMQSRGDIPTRLLGVHLGFKDGEIRDKVLENYANYAKENYSINSWVSKDRPIFLYIKDIPEKFVPLYPEEDFFDRSYNYYDVQVNLNENLSLPFKEGDIVGNIYLTHSGETKFSTGLIVKQNVNTKKFFGH